MANILDKLALGIQVVKKSFGDGSVTWFHATASPEVLRMMGLAEDKVYNTDTRTIIREEEITDGSCEVVTSDELEKIPALDAYMNRGVRGECFSIR